MKKNDPLAISTVIDPLQVYRSSVSETEIQRTIVDGLQRLGYTVCQVELFRVRCRQCGAVTGAGHGTKGTPDMYVTHPNWIVTLGGTYTIWAAMEVKKRDIKGKLSAVKPEQKVLVDAGATVIVTCWEEALAHVNLVSQNLHHARPNRPNKRTDVEHVGP